MKAVNKFYSYTWYRLFYIYKAAVFMPLFSSLQKQGDCAEKCSMKMYFLIFPAVKPGLKFSLLTRAFIPNILCLLVFFYFSCAKKGASSGNPGAESEIVSLEVQPVESFKTGKIMSKSASLCIFGRDSEMHSLLKLSEGTDVEILELDGKIDSKIIEDISEKEYFHSVYDNVDFWIEKNVLAFNCESAVAIENTFLFSDPELTKKIESKQNPLRFSAFVAVELSDGKESLEKSSEDYSDKKTVPGKAYPSSKKIFFYDYDLNAVREAYAASDSISSRKDDIIVSKIAMKLRETKKAVARNELFAEAAKYNPCKKVLAVLDDQKVEKKSYNYQEVLQSMQKRSYGVNINELMTVDQSKDPFK